MNRRNFILLSSGILLTGCDFIESFDKKIKIRFAVASNGHYGQPNTDSDLNYSTLVNAINDFDGGKKVDFCVINGDIVHDKLKFFPTAKNQLDKL